MPLYGTCKLCLQNKPLRKSHLIAAGFYRILRNLEANNANPVVVNKRRAMRCSLQVKDYVLCSDCEELLNRNGERWVINNCYNGSAFPLRSALTKVNPVVSGLDCQAFSCAATPSIHLDDLVYFASSVFWRASVHEWHVKGGTPASIDLGRTYEDSFRLFLKGDGPFPKDAAIWVFVSSNPDPLGAFYFPCAGRHATHRSYIFAILGIEFILFVGKGMPIGTRRACSFRSPQKYLYLYLSPYVDRNTIKMLGRLMSSSVASTEVSDGIKNALSS